MKLFALLATTSCALLMAACHSPETPSDTTAARTPPAATSAAPAPAIPASHTYAYQCEDLSVTARFVGQDRVDLSWAGKQLTLPSAVSADGARYADEKGNEFWGKGMKEAMFTLAGEKMRTCAGNGEEQPHAPPEGATAYATDQSGTLSTQFHAIGNEPGWLANVDLGDAPSVHIEMNYGERKLDIRGAKVADDSWVGQSKDGTPITLAFQRTPCQDSMSGASAPATVTLKVDGETLHGCGGFRTP